VRLFLKIRTSYSHCQISEIGGREDVLKMGIGNYNEECRSIVLRYSAEWEKTVKRIGRWIDFENDYKTMDPNFMVRLLVVQVACSYCVAQESIWWVFKSLDDKKLVLTSFT